MAYIEKILQALIEKRNPDSETTRRRVGMQIVCPTSEVNKVFQRFEAAIMLVAELRGELDLVRAERDSLAMSNTLLRHWEKSRNPLPTPMEWAKADYQSLMKMSLIEMEEMTVGDYHLLMGR